jgi:type 1 glutamine amidotransferase
MSNRRVNRGSVWTAISCGVCLLFGCGGGTSSPGTLPPRVLLYSFSTFAIASVPAQLAILTNKLQEWGYEVEESQDPAQFSDASLSRFAAVAMVNTCFFPFGDGASGLPEAEALQRFMRKGGGLFGTHCADVTYQTANPPALYNELIGGRGNNGFFEGASACRKLGDHPSITGLPDTFDYTGNLDNVDFLASSSAVLVKCTWQTGTEVPVSWYRTEGLGRVFYTGFAKEEIDLTTGTLLGDEHVIPGLGWVLRR